MTPERLAELKELCQKATPAPWETNIYAGNFFLSHPKAGVIPTTQDMDFIAAARTALPELIAELEALREVAAAAERNKQRGTQDKNQELLEAFKLFGEFYKTLRELR